MSSVILMKISRIYCPTAMSLVNDFFFRYPDRRPFFNQNGTRQGPRPFNFNGDRYIDYSFHRAVCKGERFFYRLAFSP